MRSLVLFLVSLVRVAKRALVIFFACSCDMQMRDEMQGTKQLKPRGLSLIVGFLDAIRKAVLLWFIQVFMTSLQ